MVIGNEIQDNVEKGLALGLSLQENNTLQGLIERELRSDDLLKSITLFDAAGTVLYSTESMQQGKKIDTGWLPVASKSATGIWQIKDRDSLVAGLQIKNNFVVTLGHVALSYTRRPLEHCMGIIGNILWQTAMVVLMVTFSGAFALLVLAFRRYSKKLLTAEKELGLLLKELDGEPHTQSRNEDVTEPCVFLEQVKSFVLAVRSTADELDRASNAVKPKTQPS
jgi:hypothetical protein